MNRSTYKILGENIFKCEVSAEARLYSLNNQYLTQRQKDMVEVVYQFPLVVQHYALALFCLWMNYSLWHSWLWSTGVGIAAWMLAIFLPVRWLWPVGLVFSGKGSTLLTLAFSVTAVVMRQYSIATYLAAASLALTSFIEAPLWMWSASSRMHPKYVIAKRIFGTKFPFEKLSD